MISNTYTPAWCSMRSHSTAVQCNSSTQSCCNSRPRSRRSVALAATQECCQITSMSISRRGLVQGTGLAALLLALGFTPAAKAGLVQFPASELKNQYILIRAGESESETQDTVLTNPVWKQSGMAGLSRRGKAQVVRQILPSMQTLGVCGEAGCWIWPSITQNAYQTAEILAGSLGVGRSRIVPEYSFLDARGVGALDGLRVSTAAQQIYAGDALDTNWRPPKGYDGTPNESVEDVLTRMRQVMSICETQYSGEDIVFISPDSDTLSILQAAVLGVDMRRHNELGFRPGEVRPLLLSQQSFDTKPMQIPCPRPPSCR